MVLVTTFNSKFCWVVVAATSVVDLHPSRANTFITQWAKSLSWRRNANSFLGVDDKDGFCHQLHRIS